MFTGIIEAVGVVESLGAGRLVLRDPGFGDLRLGESIAVNGACLTLADQSAGLAFDISDETLGRTALGDLTPGSAVNLERAMRADGRFGGHLVLGHVDCTGVVATVEDLILEVRVPSEYDRYLIDKGSVAVDGISLTVVNPQGGAFSAALVPHTLEHTNLGGRSPGERVNLEFDVLAKYLEKLALNRQGG